MIFVCLCEELGSASPGAHGEFYKAELFWGSKPAGISAGPSAQMQPSLLGKGISLEKQRILFENVMRLQQATPVSEPKHFSIHISQQTESFGDHINIY